MCKGAQNIIATATRARLRQQDVDEKSIVTSVVTQNLSCLLPRSPVILPDYVELEMRIAPGARCSAVANFDGRDTRELHEVRGGRHHAKPLTSFAAEVDEMPLLHSLGLIIWQCSGTLQRT